MLTMEQIANGIQIAAKEYPIKRADLFGSYANGTSHSDSDVDLLVEFDTPAVSLLLLAGLKSRLEELYRTQVDVIHGPLGEDSLLEIDRRVELYGA